MAKYSWIRHAANWDCIHNKHCYEDHTFFSGFNLISSLWLDIVQISILINFHCIHVLISIFDGVNNNSFADHPGCTKSLFHSACKCVFRIVRVEIFITKFLDESIGKIKVFRFKVHRQWPIARFIFFANDLLYERLNLDFVCKKKYFFSFMCVYIAKLDWHSWSFVYCNLMNQFVCVFCISFSFCLSHSSFEIVVRPYVWRSQ